MRIKSFNKKLLISSTFACSLSWANDPSTNGCYEEPVVPNPDNHAKINITFSYDQNDSGMQRLPGVGTDAITFQSYNKDLPGPSLNINDGDVKTKAEFLTKLKDVAAGKEIINFNYSGHGITLPSFYKGDSLELDEKGNLKLDFTKKEIEWMIPLPFSEIPKECDPEIKRDEIVSRLVDGQKLDHESLPVKCLDYFVTAHELFSIFENKKVYGLVDSCFSGALADTAKRKNVELALGLAAQPSEKAFDSGGHSDENHRDNAFNNLSSKHKLNRNLFERYTIYRKFLIDKKINLNKTGSIPFEYSKGNKKTLYYGPNYEKAYQELETLMPFISIMGSSGGRVSRKMADAIVKPKDFDKNNDDMVSFSEVVGSLPLVRTKIKENDHYLFQYGKQTCCRTVSCEGELGKIKLFPAVNRDLKILEKTKH